MSKLNTQNDYVPAHILAGALAHLAQHIENACPRSAYLAAMLLRQVALDPETEHNLRQEAWQLIETLERDPAPFPTRGIAPGWQTSFRENQSPINSNGGIFKFGRCA